MSYLYEVQSALFVDNRLIYCPGHYVESDDPLLDNRLREIPAPPWMESEADLIEGCEWLRERRGESSVPDLPFGGGWIRDQRNAGHDYAGCSKAEYLRCFLGVMVDTALDLGMGHPPEVPTKRKDFDQNFKKALNRVQEWAESRLPEDDEEPEPEKQTIGNPLETETQRIVLEIARNEDLSPDERGYKILAICSESSSWSSVKWGNLLDKDPSRIRQLSFWKALRSAERKPDD